MNADAILQGLSRAEEGIPHESIQAALAARIEVAPRLLERLEALIEGLRDGETPSDAELISLLYLLAEMRERRALPLVLALLELPGDVLDGYFGDFLGEGLDGILASVAGDDAAPLLRLAEDTATHPGARCCALNAVLCLVAGEKVPRAIAIEWLRGLLQRGASGEGPEAGHELWDSLFFTALDLYPGELREDLETARAKGLFDPEGMPWEELEEVIEAGQERASEALRETYALVDSAGAAIEGYLVGDEEGDCCDCGHEHTHEHGSYDDDDDGDGGEGEVAVEPLVRETPKVGRNDPCPCGSGKKHKKCCGKGAG